MMINPKELEVLHSIISKSVLLLERGLGRYQRSQRKIPVISLEKVHENDVSSPNICPHLWYENDVEVPSTSILEYSRFEFQMHDSDQFKNLLRETCVASHNSLFVWKYGYPQDPDGLSSCSLLKEPSGGISISLSPWESVSTARSYRKPRHKRCQILLPRSIAGTNQLHFLWWYQELLRQWFTRQFGMGVEHPHNMGITWTIHGDRHGDISTRTIWYK